MNYTVIEFTLCQDSVFIIILLWSRSDTFVCEHLTIVRFVMIQHTIIVVLSSGFSLLHVANYAAKQMKVDGYSEAICITKNWLSAILVWHCCSYAESQMLATHLHIRSSAFNGSYLQSEAFNMEPECSELFNSLPHFIESRWATHVTSTLCKSIIVACMEMQYLLCMQKLCF